MDDPVAILRMLERITAVLIGGLAIYFGYRLFFHLPFERSHEGQLELPGVKIVLSRVGPGVFFAAFGSLVLYYSLTTQITIGRDYVGLATDQAKVTDPGRDISLGKTFTGMSGSSTSGIGVTPQQRSRAFTTIEMLNCTQRLLTNETLRDGLQEQLSLAIRDAKRALMLSVWNEDDWGSADQLGVSGPTNDAPFQVRRIFNATYKDCPK